MKDYQYSCCGAPHHDRYNGSSEEIQNSLMEEPTLIKYSTKHASYSGDLMGRLRTPLVHFLFHRRRSKRCSFKTIVIFLVIVTLVYIQLSSGIFQRCFLEKDFGTEFRYPQDIDDFHDVVQQCVDNKGVPVDFHPSPTNRIYSNVAFLHSAEGISKSEHVGLLIIVKSATKNYMKRSAIRKTWGSKQYLKDNILETNLSTRVVFICGIPKEDHNVSQLFADERHYGDMVLAQFHDAYENNTYKTVLSMRWAVEHVGSFKYLMIVDDDMFINIANAISYIKNIPNTPVQAVTSSSSWVTSFYPVNQLKEDVCPSKRNISLEGKPLVMGQLIVDARPFRSTFGLGSKWSMSMKEYHYNKYPPYCAGGATLFDSKTVGRLYCGSFFTRHFWVDDVYIGIIAHKLGIILTNNDLMDSSYKMYYKQEMDMNFHEMIAIHGLQCPEQLVELWHTRDFESLKDCYYLKGTL